MTPDQKERIIKILWLYPDIKAKLQMKLARYPKLKSFISSIRYDVIKTSKTNNIISKVEDIVVEEESHLRDIAILTSASELIEIALDRLKPEEKEIIYMKYINDVRVTAIATKLKLSRKTVYNKIDSGIKELVKIGLIKDFTYFTHILPIIFTDNPEIM